MEKRSLLKKELENSPYNKIYLDRNLKVLYLNGNARKYLKNKKYKDLYSICADYKMKDFAGEEYEVKYDKLIETFEINEPFAIHEYIRINGKIYDFNMYSLQDSGINIAIVINFFDVTSKVENDVLGSNELLQSIISLKARLDVSNKIKEKYRVNMNQFNKLMSNVSVGYILYDEKYNIVFSSNRVYEILDFHGYSIYSWFDFNDKSSEDYRVNMMLNNYISKGKELNGYELEVNENGIKKYIEIYISYTTDENGESNTIITFKDVTKDTEIKVVKEENKKYINDVLNNIDIPILVIDCNNSNIIFSNDKMKEEFKVFEGELKKYAVLEMIPYYRRALQTKEKCCCDQIKYEDRYKKVFFYPYIGDNKEISIMYVHAIDITDEVIRVNENERLQDIRNSYFSMISHELRTPLTVIYSSLQLIDTLYSDSINDKFDAILKTINNNSRRLMRLVNNVLDMSKIDAGYLVLNEDNIEVVSFVEELVDSIIAFSKSKNINIIFDTNIEELYISIDSEKLERVILNVLSNAVKFTPSGKSIFVNLFINIEISKLYIYIKDEGVGIEEEKLPLIFNQYVEASKGKKEMEGTGLGLAIVKKFVESMGGKIEVSSVYGSGTTFDIELGFENCPEEDMIQRGVYDQISRKVKVEFSVIE